jgi:hypothetical protein
MVMDRKLAHKEDNVIRLGEILQNEDLKDTVASYVSIISHEIFNENILYMLVCYMLKHFTNSQQLAQVILNGWIDKAKVDLRQRVSDNPPVSFYTEDGDEIFVDSVIMDYISMIMNDIIEQKREQLLDTLKEACKEKNITKK